MKGKNSPSTLESLTIISRTESLTASTTTSMEI